MSNPTPKKHEQIVSSSYYHTSRSINLAKPSDKPNVSYFDVTSSRRSIKVFEFPLGRKLDYLLWYSAKVTSTFVQENGYILSRRPSASGGARHPIDILIRRPEDPNSLFYYNPFEHTLNEIVCNSSIFAAFIDHINQNLPIHNGTVIWFLAYSNRTAAKYEQPESLIWRDAGALLHCFQLNCVALELVSSPVGTLAEPFISELFEGCLSAGGLITAKEFA